MKGPGNRLKFSVVRVWECPVCHRRDRTGGDVVSRVCHCLAKRDPPQQTWMKLIEEPRPRAQPAEQPSVGDTEAKPSAESGGTADAQSPTNLTP